MAFDPIDVTAPHVAYTVLGGFIVIFGMFSLFIREKLYIGEACLAFLFGVVVGPNGANIFNPRHWANGNEDVVNEITLELTRVVLAIGVFAIGVELPKAYMAKHWKSLFFLLVPVMTWGWFVSAGLIYALIPALSFKSSLAVAACLTPTDPILAAAVVGGKYADKHVPAHLRHLLAAESGCNDGAAFPFLFIALYLTLDASPKHAVRDWFLITWLYQIVLSCVFGALIGFLFRYLMRFCERKELIDRQSYVAQYVSLAMFSNGVTTLIGSDDLLAAFCSGVAFAWDGFFNRQTEASVFSSVIDLLFNVATFIYIGAWMPFETFTNHELTLVPWRLVVIGLLVLVVRRLPIVLALYRWIPDIKTFREALFAGHFGPMGVGAIFISTLAAKELPEVPTEGELDQAEILAASIQPIVAFMVLCSIAVHGMSIPFFSLGRRVHSVRRTWSRHHSKEPPEWSHNMRHVGGPDDIVIHDPNAPRPSPRDEEGEKSGSATASVRTREGLMAEKMDDAERERRARAIPTALDDDDEEEEEEDMQAHGEGKTRERKGDVMSEWREGPHLVVERRTEEGDSEVDVEVHRNQFASDGRLKLERDIERFAGSPERVAHEVQAHLEGFGHKMENKFQHMIGHDHTPGRSMSRSPPNLTIEEPEQDQFEEEQTGDEAEWADEPGTSTGERVQRKRSGSGRKAKRRGSTAAGVVGAAAGASVRFPPTARRRSSVSQRERDQFESERGRLSAVPDRLQRTARPREVSPTRSIRFARDDDRDHDHDAPTPRSPVTPTSPQNGNGGNGNGGNSNGAGSGPATRVGSGLGLPRTHSRTPSELGASGLGLPRTNTRGSIGGSGLGLPRTVSRRDSERGD
ncbi:hypothetical protein EXIGLDRAFT_666780 [Exidia glandulosa HHB12029]|uniref:Cation/H+ exchanger transmembrane domain-containing protein n=1 Tax=Exidia glandulosa HHB12029 TaxID=1314781 RepID=A0A165NML5_EXIGL|nr:hypothetical protein EXIGLDRAFT_666780 [Exidia glandulosa HHB12029]